MSDLGQNSTAGPGLITKQNIDAVMNVKTN